MKGWVAVLGLVAALPAVAQDRLRVGVVGNPAVGSPAPELVLPYYTVGGAGPADQPFRLSAELGRVVVLVFGPAADSAGWAAIGAQADSMGASAVLAGVVKAAPRVAEQAAGRLGTNRVKLLADSLGRGHRRFGVRPGGWEAFVIDDTGRVAFRVGFESGSADALGKVAVVVDRSLGRAP